MWLSVIQAAGVWPRAVLTLAVAVLNVMAIICGDDVDESCVGDSSGTGRAAAEGLMGAFVPVPKPGLLCYVCFIVCRWHEDGEAEAGR